MDRKRAVLTVFLIGWVGAGSALAQQAPVDPNDIEPNVVGVRDESEVTEEEADSPAIVAVAAYRDPLQPLNRAIFAFNDVSYRYVITPAARAYRTSVPPPVRTGIGNFFHNLKTPIYLVNHLLQGKPREAGTDVGRFLINTTIGVLGFMDPATTRFELEKRTPSAGDTLEGYGAGYGIYLVLPFIGPSNLRDGGGTMFDSMLNPIQYTMDNPEGLAVRIFDNFQQYAPFAETYFDIRDESQDPYIFMRNLHLQGLERDAAYAEE